MQVVIRTNARTDILKQFEWYAHEKDAPHIAERFLKGVQDSIEMLCRMPRSGAPKLLNNSALQGLRSWPVSEFRNLRIYYLCQDDALCIVRVLHGRRDINPLLEGECGDEED